MYVYTSSINSRSNRNRDRDSHRRDRDRDRDMGDRGDRPRSPRGFSRRPDSDDEEDDRDRRKRGKTWGTERTDQDHLEGSQEDLIVMMKRMIETGGREVSNSDLVSRFCQISDGAYFPKTCTGIKSIAFIMMRPIHINCFLGWTRHSCFKLDIIHVKRTFKNTSFPGMKIDPKYAFCMLFS